MKLKHERETKLGLISFTVTKRDTQDQHYGAFYIHKVKASLLLQTIAIDPAGK